ncbi:MAG: hypothetical protein KAS32_06810 [Candidatus Peribacteraceae bacterium]|nr:hypothetical protein [Candidatus Peribacteraceae bacterium]
MPFKEGNTLAKQNKGVAKHAFIDELLKFVASGGARKVQKILEKMLEGKTISMAEKEGVETFLKLLPYKKPRLASIEQKTDITGDINFKWE